VKQKNILKFLFMDISLMSRAMSTTAISLFTYVEKAHPISR